MTIADSDYKKTPTNFKVKCTGKSIKKENHESKEFEIETNVPGSILPKPPNIIRILLNKSRNKVKEMRVKPTIQYKQCYPSSNFFQKVEPQ